MITDKQPASKYRADRPELAPSLLEVVAEEWGRRENIEDELDDYLDHELGPFTTQYTIVGRIGGRRVEIRINPLDQSRKFLKELILGAWAEQQLPIVPVPHWTTWPESQQFNRKKAYARLCQRHAELVAEGDPWEAYERDALAFLDEFDARWHVPIGAG